MLPFTTPAGFPDFPAVTPAAMREALPRLLDEAEARVAALEAAPEPTWEGRVRALTEATRPLTFAWHLVEHLLGVCNDDAWRALEEEFQPAVVRFSLRVAQSRPLHAALRALRDAPDAGVALEGEARERFVAAATRLSELSTKFANNVLDATKAFSLVLRTEDEAAGLPPSVRELLAASAREAGEEGATAERGPWRVTLERAISGPFLQYAERRDLRETVYRASIARASAAPLDNGPVLDEILALRREQAARLGFPTYARLVLDSRMAKEPGAVYAMIDRIGEAALAKGRAELASLRAFAPENGFSEALAPWDLAFWSRRQLEALYGYSPETLRPYFPFPRVLEGLFGLARELFGVAVEPADGEAPVWHPDVRFFRVRGEDGAVLAHFYLDPYSRPATKRGGAWMDELRSRERRPDGALELPLALLCCNQAPPAGGRPSLMTLYDVETVFHEFGHALQGMLTRVDDPECAGINNVEWDAVELASQFMENWCREPGPLRALSRHVDTGEPLPDDLISRIRGAATFGTGRATMRQLSFALADMDLHEKVPCPEMPDADAAQRVAFDRFADLPPLPENRFLRSFTHIFSGGYAAGYYSYMWADILAHDAFGAFEDAGLDDPAARAATGRRYAATVLALGGSRPPADVFRAFRGRDPSPDALLRHTGLA